MAAIVTSILIWLSGCDEPPPPPDPYLHKQTDGIKPDGAKEIPRQRFSFEYHGRFEGGYGGHRHDIMVITDTKTGRKYLSITGAGTTELSDEKQGRTNVTTED